MKKTLFIFLLYFCANVYAQPKVKLETIFSINDDKTTQKEYMFKHVMDIITDDENNFYVHENAGTEIRKFSNDGKYIRTIGRNGEGPGEFKHIMQMYINTKNELVVRDPPNYRISYFNLNGKYLRSAPFKSGSPYFDKVQRYNNDSYIALKSVNNNNLEHGNKIVVYDDGFQNLITSFGHSSIFWKYNDVFELNMDKWNALNITFNDKNVFAAKKFYDGNIYIFDKNKNWEVRTVEGKQIKKPGYEIIEKMSNQVEWKNIIGGGIGFGEEWGGKHRVFTIIYRYTSIGIVNYKNKYILNFLVSCVNQKECELGADVYNTDGIYLGYSKIEKGENISLNSNVFCIDNESYFLMRDGYSVIKKIKLTID